MWLWLVHLPMKIFNGADAPRRLRAARRWHAARKKGSFLPRGMTAVFAVAEAPVSVDTLVIPASFVPRVIVGRVRCRAS